MVSTDSAWLVPAVTATEGALGTVVADVDTDDASGTDVAVRSVSEQSPGCDGTVLLLMLSGALCVVPLTAWEGNEIRSTTTNALLESRAPCAL